MWEEAPQSLPKISIVKHNLFWLWVLRIISLQYLHFFLKQGVKADIIFSGAKKCLISKYRYVFRTSFETGKSELEQEILSTVAVKTLF